MPAKRPLNLAPVPVAIDIGTKLRRATSVVIKTRPDGSEGAVKQRAIDTFTRVPSG